MPSNSEMYERGALDAEHDDINPFYYQHYYYYRKGYDVARRQMRRGLPTRAPWGRWALLLLLALGAMGGLGFWLAGRGQAEAPAAALPQPTIAPTVAPQPTAEPTAEPTPEPTPAPAPQLAVGGRARVVNLNGAPLRARQAPGLTPRVIARIPEGSEVSLLEGPVEADGYVWWRVQAGDQVGWSAERSPEGLSFLEPLP